MDPSTGPSPRTPTSGRSEDGEDAGEDARGPSSWRAELFSLSNPPSAPPFSRKEGRRGVDPRRRLLKQLSPTDAVHEGAHRRVGDEYHCQSVAALLGGRYTLHNGVTRPRASRHFLAHSPPPASRSAPASPETRAVLRSPPARAESATGSPREPDGPTVTSDAIAYQSSCRSVRVLPRPLDRVDALCAPHDGKLSFRGSLLNDATFRSFVARLALLPGQLGSIRSLDLARNRVSGPGAEAFLAQPVLLASLTSLDLSHNTLDSRFAPGLARFLRAHNCRLTALSLEHNALDDSALTAILSALRRSRDRALPHSLVRGWSPVLVASRREGAGALELESLRLGANRFGPASAAELVDYIKENPYLEELSLHWVRLGEETTAPLCAAIEECAHLATVDLAWCSFGGHSDGGRQLASALADAANRRPSLTHLNLANNFLSVGAMEAFARIIEPNRTLLGLDLEGNAAVVDALGFVHPIDPEAPADRSPLPTRVGCAARLQLSHAAALARVVNPVDTETSRRQGARGGACWLCNGWREQRLEFRPGSSGPDGDRICFFGAFDDWRADPMWMEEAEETGARRRTLLRMMPPGHHQLLFSVDDVAMIAQDQDVAVTVTEVVLRRPLEVVGFPGTPTEVLIPAHSFVNELVVPELTAEEAKRPFQCRPRGKGSARPLPPSVVPPWSFARSVFASYRRDTEEVLDRSFWNDVRQSRIAELVKEESDRTHVLDVLHAHWRVIKAIHKHYAALSEACFWVNAASFLEFVFTCGIPDEANPRSNLVSMDLLFVAGQFDPAGRARNKSRFLSRHQTLEMIVRLAIAKLGDAFPAPGRYAAAVDALLTRHILPFAARFDIDEWREQRLYLESVDLLYRERLNGLSLAFSKLVERHTRAPHKPPCFRVEHWRSFVDAAGLVDPVFFPARAADFAFVRSLQTVEDEMAVDDHEEMHLVEFLEGLAHIAEIRTTRFATMRQQLKAVATVAAAIGQEIAAGVSLRAARTKETIVEAEASARRLCGAVGALEDLASEGGRAMVDSSREREVAGSVHSRTEPALDVLRHDDEAREGEAGGGGGGAGGGGGGARSVSFASAAPRGSSSSLSRRPTAQQLLSPASSSSLRRLAGAALDRSRRRALVPREPSYVSFVSLRNELVVVLDATVAFGMH